MLAWPVRGIMKCKRKIKKNYLIIAISSSLFHNNASIAALYSGPTPLRNSLPIRHLITLHPVKQPEAMRRIHCQAEFLRIKQLRQKRMQLVERLEEIGAKRFYQENEIRRIGETVQQQGKLN